MAALQHCRDGFIVTRIFFTVAWTAAAINFIECFGVRTFKHAFDVLRRRLRFPVLDHAMHLIVSHERAVNAIRNSRAAEHEQHIAAPEERLCAHLIQDRAAVDFARDLKRDARGHVSLNQPGDHVHRWPLRGQDQMDARSARLLCKARNQLFNFLASRHHQVRKLINHHDDERQLFERLRLVWCERERIGEWHAARLRLTHFLIEA